MSSRDSSGNSFLGCTRHGSGFRDCVWRLHSHPRYQGILSREAARDTPRKLHPVQPGPELRVPPLPNPRHSLRCLAHPAPCNVELFSYLATAFLRSSLNLIGFFVLLLLLTSNVSSPFSISTLTTPPDRTLLITIIVATGLRILS